MSSQVPNRIAILARDGVSGQALELLLQSAGYNTRLLSDNANGELAEALDGAGLLLLAPTRNTKSRESLLRTVRSTPVMAKIPVLEMITSLNGAQTVQEGQVLWPCRIEDLKAKIEAALRNGSSPEPL